MILLLAENPGAIQKVGTPGPHRAPQGPGLCPTPARAGTDPEKKRKTKTKSGQVGFELAAPPQTTEPVVKRLIVHFNDTCHGTIATADKGARKLLLAILDTYTAEDVQMVNTWAAQRWPPGSKHSYCCKPSFLYGDRFGEHLSQAKQAEKEPRPGVFHPGKEFML